MNSPSSPPDPVFLLVGDSPAFLRAAEAGIGLGFPGARVEKAGSVEAAAQGVGNAENVVICLLSPRETDVVAAQQALDAVGLPRWALIVFGDLPVADEVATVTRPDEHPRIVARALRLALAVHRLRYENARCRGDLSAIGTRVIHDLRSPLGGVLTTVEVLKEVLAEEAPGRVALLEPILESTEGLAKLIRQLGVLAKASGGENPRQRFGMGLAFWSAFQRVEREALALGATIVQPAAWPEVEGEQGWTEAIWHALLGNSLQYGGAKPRIEVGWTRQGSENRFWIIDPGEVPPAKRPALFTPFHLLHRPNAPRGFGLPIVRRLVELQGGKSGYEPAPAGGSCFFFTLPNGKAISGDQVLISHHAKS
jgi:signal transduction histidine kinase